MTIVKTICPSGFYCPTGTSVPTKCPAYAICPEGSGRPIQCPTGSFMNKSANASEAKDVGSLCIFCPKGQYSGVIDCDPCPAGYVCLGQTTVKFPVDISVDHGYECPKGFYCPEGSYKEKPCPIGYYKNTKKGKNITDCVMCPNNTFNDEIGQAACRKCGPSAYSSMGQTTCQCLGKHREFFKTDSSCRCISGFYQISEGGFISEKGDSAFDCEPTVYKQCGKNEIYDQR